MGLKVGVFCNRVRVWYVGGCTPHDKQSAGVSGACRQKFFDQVEWHGWETPEEMRRVGDGCPSFRLSEIKLQAVLVRDIAQLDVGSSTGGKNFPSRLDSLLIHPKAGIACSQNDEWVLLQ